MSELLLEVNNLVKYFPIRAGFLRRIVNHVRAVDGVSFTVHKGETLGLVGESGCGKTTTARTILRLQEPTSGSIKFEGQDLLKLRKRELRLKRRDMQIIFQDPYSSLNPRLTVGQIIGEPLRIHKMVAGADLEARVKSLLEKVGLASYHYRRYPHEFSGGQRQRIGIARALALNPKLIVCDEPVSALDVSIQSQILNLLEDLQKEFDLTYLFIAHNLSVVKHISDRVGVMYLGKLVEMTTSNKLYAEPLHPYTQVLLSAIPQPDARRERKRIVVQGDVPSPINPPAGCRFHTRCPYVVDRCKSEVPEWSEVRPEHFVACHLAK
ncbi:MAG: dipeptide ABC transporter ATP-binding protein [Selenomonadales bacterium]|jgi:oligopeptide/dipeptide ABC transporter ATP-binding protein|nr:dipeptide ABC transporter ATP-binding protein [Selenomonadales bacterium]